MLSVSDAKIRRFLLAQLSENDRTAFEAKLFADSQLERRARLIELELIDDYVASRLKAKQRVAFQQKFLVAAARQRKLAVSTALRKSLSDDPASRPAHSSARQFAWPRVAWKVAFGVIALAVIFASALVIRKEPKIVRQIIPKRSRPAPVPSQNPVTAHHPTNSTDSPEHRDESQQRPPHEASPLMIVLRPSVTADNPPVITLAQNNSANVVRLELLMGKTESATFAIIVANSSGEVVHNVPEIRVEGSDRIDFDVQLERLKPGEYQVTLTRLTGEMGVAGTYYFRVH